MLVHFPFFETTEVGIIHHFDAIHDLIDGVFPFEWAESRAEKFAADTLQPVINPLAFIEHLLSSLFYRLYEFLNFFN